MQQAVEHLRGQQGVPTEMEEAARIDGAGPIRTFLSVILPQAVPALTAVALFHFGNADAFIPNDGVDAVGAAIAGRDGFVLNVENAGHAFDNHESEMFWNESAAKTAWAKTMAFLGLYLPA